MDTSTIAPYQELDDVLRNFAENQRVTLKQNFVGMYLQGSLALGDFDLTSDVDFIIVTHDELSADQVKEVQTLHTGFFTQDNRWVKRLEYSFFSKQMLRVNSSPYISGKRVDSPDRNLWYFDNGSPIIKMSDHCNTLVTRWTVREKGITMFGPNPTTLIDPISANELRQEIRDTLVGWGEELLTDPNPYRNRFYQSYLVLNFSRMLHNLHEGIVGSKLAGITWAKSHLDPLWIELIDYCWVERQDTTISVKQPAKQEIFEQSLRFVRYVVEQGNKYIIL